MSDLNISPDEKIAGVPLARLLRNLEETSYNEGALDLACRLSDCKAVIEALLSDRAAPVPVTVQQDKSVRLAGAPAGQQEASGAAWISTRMQKPKAGQACIINIRTKYVNAPPHDSVSAARFDGCNWCADGHHLYEPTHWMPMPPPPVQTSRAQRTTIDNAPATGIPAGGAVEGWKWVPVEMSDEMWRAWQGISNELSAREMDAIYAAMLAAAPSHPSAAKAGEDA